MQIDTNSGDLLVAPSGALVAHSDNFIAEVVLLASRGDFKEHPLLGAEARQMQAGNLDPFWPGNTKKMLRACGLEVINLTLSPQGVITIT